MDTRQHIIETAYAAFYRHGFHACGVEFLAQHAGVTKRTLYAHFGSKDGLIEAVLQYRHQQFVAQMQAALDEVSLNETVSAYLDFIAAWGQTDAFSGCLFVNACAEYAEAAAMPHRYAQQHKQEIRRILASRLQNAGKTNAKHLADLLFVFGEGMIVAAQSGHKDLLALRSEIIRILSI